MAIDFDGFDLPAERLELTTGNVRWLIRNIAVRNANHPRLAEVVEQLKDRFRRAA